MKKRPSIIFTIQFIDLLNQPIAGLYHEIRVIGDRNAISAGKSNESGKGVPISRPPGTLLEIIIKHPVTKQPLKLPQYFNVPQTKGTLRVQAPFTLQKMKLRALADQAGQYRKKVHEVKAGESLYSIAKDFNTTWQVLYNLNKDTVKPDYKIYPGNRLKLPPKNSGLRGFTNDKPTISSSQETYTLKKNDTLWDISQETGIPVSELKRINNISEPKKLQAGQTIKLRGKSAPNVDNLKKPPMGRLPSSSSNRSPKDNDSGLLDKVGDAVSDTWKNVKEGFEDFNEAISGKKEDKPTTNNNSNSPSKTVHIVKSGDTLTGIAKNYGVSAHNIARANGIDYNSTILVGQKLVIPSGSASGGSNHSTNSNTSNSSTPIKVKSTDDNGADRYPKSILTTDGDCVCKTYDLIWGAKVSCEFRKKVIEICQDLWPDDYLNMANNLMALIHLETDGSFDPSIINSLGYVGLVQIGAEAREDLGVTKNELANMSAIEQLEYVKEYFKLYNNRHKKIDSFVEMYLTVLYPNTVKPAGVDLDDNDIIFKDNGQEEGNPYRSNPIFMKEKDESKVRETTQQGEKIRGFKDGKTYAWEVKKEIRHHYTDGEKIENRKFIATCGNAIQKPEIIDRCKPLSKRNEEKVTKLHPKIRCSVRDFINDAEKDLGIKLVIVQGLRTYEEQNRLYAKGRTAPGSVVTKAKGGQSNHNFGVAIDVFPLHEDGKLHMADDKKNIELLKKVAPIGKRHGFKWGGDWKSFKDYPHFENMYGKSLSELRQLYRNANGIIEKISL